MTDHLQPVTSIQSLRSGCSTCLSYRPNDTFHSHGDSSLMRVMKSCLWLSYLAREVCAVPAISTHASNQPLFHTQNHFGGVRFNTRLHIRTGEKQRERESILCKEFVLYDHFQGQQNTNIACCSHKRRCRKTSPLNRLIKKLFVQVGLNDAVILAPVRMIKNTCVLQANSS